MKNNLSKQYPNVYEMYGIYVDWQIDRNIIPFGRDPHSISNFEDFLKDSNFEIVIVTINNKKMLSIDLNLKHYKHLKQLRLNPDSVFASNVTGVEAENLLIKYSEERKLPVLDILSFYYTTTASEGGELRKRAR